MADLERIKSMLKVIPDFPKPGILFQDIFPIFQDPIAVETIITHMTHHINSTYSHKIDVIVGLDARGFLFGPLLAMRLGAAFIPVRKAGKLPGECTQVGYTKEYGTDYFEMQAGVIPTGAKCVVVDDLLATGGSAFAAGELVKKSGGEIVEFVFLVELLGLGGVEKLKGHGAVYSLIKTVG